MLLLGLIALPACRNQPEAPEGGLLLSGNIEAVDAQLAFKVPGRIVARLANEGDRVAAGQPLARLDPAEQQAELDLRRAQRAAAGARLAELEAGARAEETAAAAAAVRSAEATQERARLELERQQSLFTQEAVASRELETAQADFAVAAARTAEATERLKLLQAGTRSEVLAQARAQVAQAEAAVALAATRLADTTLSSPFAGVVLVHHLEPGEFVVPGTPVVTLATLDAVWVRAYVNQTDLGRLRHGQAVDVRVDTYPEKSYAGTIGFIAAEAEFTPRTVQTHQERVRQVFRIKVDVPNPDGELKPGMPADVIIPPP